MKTIHTLFASLAVLLGTPARAQAAEAVCRVAEPPPPAVAWRGRAAYIAKATIRDGRVVQLEVRSLTTGIDRQSQRSLVMAVSKALDVAACPPGEHVFERRFDFDLREAPTPEALAAADRGPVSILTLPASGNEVCRVEETQLPVLAGRGQAAYLAGVEILDGRVLRSEVRVLTPGAVKNDAQRLPMNAIRAAMSAAQCPPGRYIVHKRFVFDLHTEAPTVWTP